MLPLSHARVAFFPKADAGVLRSKYSPPPFDSRPTTVAPILDVEHAHLPLESWSSDVVNSAYPSQDDVWAPARIPEQSNVQLQCAADRYLFPVLTRNERLRLTMLFYYTRGALEDQELMSRLQEKVILAREVVGWEFVIAGLLSHNTFTRMVTVGLPLAVLPRRESTCAHTVNQPPGTVFSLLNMVEDWRFRESPHVDQGGLRAYAGVPLRFDTEFREHIAFGSLCVASNSPQATLSIEQQRALAHLADAIVSDIIQSARNRRQRERRRMLEIINDAQAQIDQGVDMEEAIPVLLRNVYPFTTVGIYKSTTSYLSLDGGTRIPIADFEEGLWEDTEHFERVIKERNHLGMLASNVVRVVGQQCTSQRIPTFILVASKDFRTIFDDVDSWFVQMCATILSRYWQRRLLKEALTAKDAFLRGITHQLRTPIHGILGSVELLSEELKQRNIVNTTVSSPVSSPSVEQIDPYTYIRTIQTSAKDLISTVNSLIKLNRWADITKSSKQLTLHKIEEILSALLAETLQALPEDVSRQTNIFLYHDLPPRCDMLAIDMRLFLDCVQPLVVNALQNTAGGIVSVTMIIPEDFSSLTVDVKDNGCGIAPENTKRIFDSYVKVDSSTTEAGLGLTLACRAATLMDGHVSLVTSELGTGSHFRAVINEPVCASSIHSVTPLKERLLHLPGTFHASSVVSKTTSLNDHLVKFLIIHRYIPSAKPTQSLLLIEYTDDPALLQQRTSAMDKGQVAVCLVPETDKLLVFGNSFILQEKNIVYVKGPFLPDRLEAALKQADSIISEHVSWCQVKDGQLPNESETISPFAVKNETSNLPKTRLTVSMHRGSIFPQTAEIDLSKSVMDLQIKNAPPIPQLPFSGCTQPMTLLVDDNHVNLRLLEMYCKRRSVPHRTAINGAEAIDLFFKHRCPTKDNLLVQQLVTQPFDLVLMDLQMPVCDGIAATRSIREMERRNGWKRTVLCIVTGQDSPVDRTDAQDAGADGFLVKPVGPKVLDRWIKSKLPNALLG